jgi:hypothetical protein
LQGLEEATRAGLIKRQKSFQGLAMYGHEVMMSLQKRAKLFGTLFPFQVSDIRRYRTTVYFMEKRRHPGQAIIFMSDLNDVNFPVP